METTTEKSERGWTYDPASGVMARKIAGFPAITLNVGRLVNGQFKLHSVSPEVFFAAAVYGLGVRADRATANDKTDKASGTVPTASCVTTALAPHRGLCGRRPRRRPHANSASWPSSRAKR